MAQSTGDGHTPRGRLHTPEDINLGEFFTRDDGRSTIARNADLEAAVPNQDKDDLIEIDRYWVKEPYSFAVVYESSSENEKQYFVVEPTLTSEEKRLITFLKDKIRTSLDYSDVRTRATNEQRVITLREKAFELLRNYNLIDQDHITGDQEVQDETDVRTLPSIINSVIDIIYERTGGGGTTPAELNSQQQTRQTLDRSQVEKILYYVIRDFIRYDRIDPIMEDPNVEDISIEGWGGTVFVEHSSHEHLITNVQFGQDDLDEFVTTLAQKANKGISKRQPDVNATLDDGSRAILMLGDEITDKGSTFTIRDFNDIPFTPVDLINWGTFSLEEMVYLWLAVENGKSAIIAGGTSSGKTTTLNAISLFIPAVKKIVSIEDTRELRIPQKNWIPLNTRESFANNETNEITESHLLMNTLRMSPQYVIFGEVRKVEAARSLFQNLNTGHTAFSTFHAKNARELRVRLTTDPINVDETSFGGLDIIISQERRNIDGQKVRRATSIVELEEYIPTYEEFSTSTPFNWDQDTDTHQGELEPEDIRSNSPLMQEVKNENGWSDKEMQREIARRKIVLAYLIDNDMKDYVDVSATIQGYMYSKENVLSEIADGSLSSSTEKFQNIRNIDIDVNQKLEEGVPRPPTDSKTRSKARDILQTHSELYEDITLNLNDQRAGGRVKEIEGRSPDKEAGTEEDLWGGDQPAE